MRYITSMLQSDLYDLSDANIIVKGKIIAHRRRRRRRRRANRNIDAYNRKLDLNICGPLTSFGSNISNTLIDNAEV